ncbi:hypothetical protein PMV_120 [Port-miou virus]|uniref:Uncharacterized protein n=1 Tax=Port-miou virus TaxID=1733873 RepID=A0A0N9P6M4_9VIRU|nr:hypothetical protein PMV_120 [Port-miou virus]
MSRKVFLSPETKVVSMKGEYTKVRDLLPGDSVLSCDSCPNKILQISVTRKRTLKIGKLRTAEQQELLVYEAPLRRDFQDTRYMELGLFEPLKVKAKDFNCQTHFLFRTVALWPFSELEDEPFVVGKRCASLSEPYPKKAMENDKRTRSLLLSGDLMAEQRSPSFLFVCCSLGLDPTKKRSELMDDLATSNCCSLIRTYQEDPKKSQVFCLEFERDKPIFLEDFVNI